MTFICYNRRVVVKSKLIIKMIYVYIKKELAKFETDIRDLCLAFFTLQKIKYIIGDEEVSSMVKDNELCEPNIIVKD